jgi:hypothetical protein
MFVLVSMPQKMQWRGQSLNDVLASMDECVVGVFATKDLAVQNISVYAGSSHAGKAALIYEMVPVGNKQKRVKIYEGSFPLCAPKKTSDDKQPSLAYLNGHTKILNKRIQKLEEKLEAKGAECNRLKIENSEMAMSNDLTKIVNKHTQRLEEKLEAKGAECNRLKDENTEMRALINRMKILIQA